MSLGKIDRIFDDELLSDIQRYAVEPEEQMQDYDIVASYSLEPNPETGGFGIVTRLVSKEDSDRIQKFEKQLEETRQLHRMLLLKKEGDWQKDVNNLERNQREVLVVNTPDHPEGAA